MPDQPKNTPHYVGHRQRLKARLVDNPRGLADYEILELLLALTLPRRDTKPIAKALVDRFGSLKEAILVRPDQLDGIKGIGPATQSQWTLIQELTPAWARPTPGAARSSTTPMRWPGPPKPASGTRTPRNSGRYSWTPKTASSAGNK